MPAPYKGWFGLRSRNVTGRGREVSFRFAPKAHCQPALPAIKKAHHPTNRDERQSFRGTTRNSLDQAQLFSADTPQTVNAVTRPSLLIFQAAAPGRKPGIARKRIPPSRSLYGRKPTQGSPISAFQYLQHSSTEFLNMQVIFMSLTKIKRHDMVTSTQ